MDSLKLYKVAVENGEYSCNEVEISVDEWLNLLQDKDALTCAPCRYAVFYPSRPQTKGQYLEITTKVNAKCMCMHNQSNAQRR